MAKTPPSELDYRQAVIDLQKIDPSPHQHRRHFDGNTLRELAVSIQREGLIEPIVVRAKRDRYELIAGERRFRAVRDFTEMETIQAQIVVASNLQARRISAAENLQREDLSAIETIEAIVEIMDVELVEDEEYAAMGKKECLLDLIQDFNTKSLTPTSLRGKISRARGCNQNVLSRKVRSTNWEPRHFHSSKHRLKTVLQSLQRMVWVMINSRS